MQTQQLGHHVECYLAGHAHGVGLNDVGAHQEHAVHLRGHSDKRRVVNGPFQIDRRQAVARKDDELPTSWLAKLETRLGCRAAPLKPVSQPY